MTETMGILYEGDLSPKSITDSDEWQDGGTQPMSETREPAHAGEEPLDEMEEIIKRVISFPDGSKLTIQVDAHAGADDATVAFYRYILGALNGIEAQRQNPNLRDADGI
jgi:hypothetical protein